MLTIEPCVFLQRGRGRLGQEQRRLQIGADQIVPVLDIDVADHRRIERRRVVDERVELAECLHRLLDQRRQLADVEQVRLDQRDGIGAQMIELGLQQARFAGRCAKMQHDGGARLVQPPADVGADPLGAAGDQYDPAFQARPCLR